MDIHDKIKEDYKYGFESPIENENFPVGLSEEIVRLISAKKDEPEWLLNYRIKAFNHFKTLEAPTWPSFIPPLHDFSTMQFFSRPKTEVKEVDEELSRTFEKLGIPLSEQQRIMGVAVDAVIDSVSIATTYKEELGKVGVIFCSISDAVKDHPDLVKKYFGSVVPYSDNYYAALNAAVFSDGSFCYIPKNITCPLDLSTYFRINAKNTGQFERTLIIAEDNSFVNYLEGCTAPSRSEQQLHAAVVELIALENATINYSTVQNWYSGDKDGKGGILNFVTKRGLCKGKKSKISWTQVEAGAAITWKYPSCILLGDQSEGYFYSVALTNNHMQADTGTKMIHIGKKTKSSIISKGISADQSCNTYRGLVKIMPSAKGSRNFSQCDSMLIGDQSSALTFPTIDVREQNSVVEHEASTSKISFDQIFYLESRGLSKEKAISFLVHGFCKDIFKELPLEFSKEAVKLIELKLENSVG